MLVFLYGKDSYRIKEQTDKILDGYLKKNASGVNIYRTSEASSPLELIEQAVKTLGFFDEKKIILVKDIFTTPYAAKLTEVIERWDLIKTKDVILIVTESMKESELNKKSKALLGILKTGEIVKEIEPLEGPKLATWVKAKFKDRGVEIEPAAIKKLIEHVSTDNSTDLSWRLIQEIDKLSNFTTSVTESDIGTLVTTQTEQQIFPILDSIGEKNNVRAFILLYKNIAAGMDPWYIFSMIGYQFRNLLTMKSLSKEPLPFPEIVKKSGLNPYVARKSFDMAKKYELDELKNKFSRLADIEISTKSGLSDITDEIYGLVF